MVPDAIASVVAAVHQYNVTCAPTVTWRWRHSPTDVGSIRPGHTSRASGRSSWERSNGSGSCRWRPRRRSSDFRSVAKESIPLAERLLAEADVLTVPGAAFGAAGEGFLRITYGANPRDEETIEGLRRVAGWMSENASKGNRNG